MDDREKIEKFARNTKGKEMHTPMPVDEVRSILIEQGDNWRTVWESIPTDGIFDSLYNGNDLDGSRYEALVYEGELLVRESINNGAPFWYWEDDKLTWLLEHPPFPNLIPIATLFTHSHGIEAGASPWLLFQYVIGTAVTSQGMGLNSLMGIGSEDAMFLGRALAAWGEFHDVAEPYVELLLEAGGEEG